MSKADWAGRRETIVDSRGKLPSVVNKAQSSPESWGEKVTCVAESKVKAGKLPRERRAPQEVQEMEGLKLTKLSAIAEPTVTNNEVKSPRVETSGQLVQEMKGVKVIPIPLAS